MSVTKPAEPMPYKPLTKGLDNIGAPSRGIVLFNNGKGTMWQSPDGYHVMKWAESHSIPGNQYYDAALRNGGVHHAVVWVYSLGDVTYETTD